MAAAFAPPSQTASPTSGLPEALRPAVTADQRNPRGREVEEEVLLTGRFYGFWFFAIAAPYPNVSPKSA
jgi:hypothetical protein